MGNIKPKTTAKIYKPEVCTPALRARVAEILESNRHANVVGLRSKGASGWKIESHADIADELSRMFGKEIGQTQVRNLLGGARDGAAPKTIRSKYVPAIRDILGIEEIQISVPADRADVLKTIAALPESAFAAHREAVANKKS